MIWQTSRFQIDLSQPRVMGIVNVTPDSFSDGGRYFSSASQSAAVFDRCAQLVQEGADILDIGGESTRPGATPLPLDEELARVLPVVRQAVQLGVPVSVDTYKPEVMQAVLDLGADIINDIWALRQAGAQRVIAGHPACGVCLMHMHGEPISMQLAPMQGEVVAPVKAFLTERAAQLVALGVDSRRIVLDYGIGFGKTVAQNFSLLAQQRELANLGYSLLAGWSRKSSLATVAGAAAGNALSASPAAPNVLERMVPSVVAAVLAAERGARVLRVHDVRETVQALKVWNAASQPTS